MENPLYYGTVGGVSYGGTYGVITGQPVPEPSTLVFLAAGAVACVGITRRLRRSN